MKSALLIMTLRGHMGYVSDLCVSPNNALLASVDTTFVIRIWELSTGIPLAALAGHSKRESPTFVYTLIDVVL